MTDIKDPENTIIMTLKGGDVVIQLLPDVAPKHTERMKELARAGAYDNVCFHRVIDGFMAQTGDVANGNTEKNFDLRRAGTGGSELPDLPAEFSKLPHDRGTLGAARSSNPNSANSQFFIMFREGYFLNGQYTVFGRVIEGLDVLDAIASVECEFGASGEQSNNPAATKAPTSPRRRTRPPRGSRSFVTPTSVACSCTCVATSRPCGVWCSSTRRPPIRPSTDPTRPPASRATSGRPTMRPGRAKPPQI